MAALPGPPPHDPVPADELAGDIEWERRLHRMLTHRQARDRITVDEATETVLRERLGRSDDG